MQRLGRPHVTVKWAQSLDGRAAASDGTSQWITGPAARRDVHRRRAEADAIIAGIGTVLADDPALTARDAAGDAPAAPAAAGRAGSAAGARRARPCCGIRSPSCSTPATTCRPPSPTCASAGVQRVFVEGGPTIASAFLREGLVDEVLAYIAPVLLGGDRLALGDIGIGTIGDAQRLAVASVERLGDDLLVIATPQRTRRGRRRRRPRTPRRRRRVMFTGIVEEIGEVTDVAPSGDGVRLTVRAPKAVSDAAHGDSISVSGVCLTVVDQGEDWFTADVMKQTLDMSTLAGVGAGRAVNLERATQAHGRLGGHIVQGHIDGTGEVLEVRRGAQWRVLRISLARRPRPARRRQGLDRRRRRLADRQCGERPERRATAHWFEVSLIPETLEATTLGARRAGDRVNLETDILARHVQRLLSFTAPAARAPRGSFAAAAPHSAASIERKEARDEPFHHPRSPRRAARRAARHRRRR